MLTTYLPKEPEIALPHPSLCELTPREWDVLLQVADELTNVEIAARLYIAPKSVETNRTRIGAKLNLLGLGKLARFARINKKALYQCYTVFVGKLPPI